MQCEYCKTELVLTVKQFKEYIVEAYWKGYNHHIKKQKKVK